MKFILITLLILILTQSNIVFADEQGDREREILRENPDSETYNEDQTMLEERERKREEERKRKEKAKSKKGKK